AVSAKDSDIRCVEVDDAAEKSQFEIELGLFRQPGQSGDRGLGLIGRALARLCHRMPLRVAKKGRAAGRHQSNYNGSAPLVQRVVLALRPTAPQSWRGTVPDAG